MKVMVAGGGNVGSFIARELETAGHDVVILEVDPERVERARADKRSGGARWIECDACEINELARVEPQAVDVLAAVTGDDEDNLVISLLAKQEFGVPRVVARVNHPENEWLFSESWGVDVSVSTPHLLTALVTEAVSVGSLVRLLSLEHGDARLVEVTLAEGSPAAEREISELALPREASVVAIVRGQHVIVPRGDTVLHGLDEVLLLVTGAVDDEVTAALVGA